MSEDDAVSLSGKVPELIKEITTMERYIDEKIKNLPSDVTRVILIGNCGAGKTTLLHNLVGVKFTGKMDDAGMMCMECDPNDVLEDPITKRKYKMDSGLQAATYLPNVYQQGKIVYFDCAGFCDPDLSKRVVNAFAIDRILSVPCRVKILLVFPAPSFQVNRGDAVKKAIDVLEKMFQTKSQLVNALGVVVTRGRSKIPGFNIFKKLKDLNTSTSGDDKNKKETIPLPETVNLLMEHPDHVFAFPDADDGEEYDFPDKDKIISFSSSYPIVNPDHKPALDKEGEYVVFFIGNALNAQKKAAYDLLIDRLLSEIKNISSLETVQKYRTALKALKLASSRSNLIAFIEACHELEKISSEFHEPYNQLQELKNSDSFVHKLAKVSRHGSSYEDTFKLEATEKQIENIITTLDVKKEFLEGEIDRETAARRLKEAEERNRSYQTEFNRSYDRRSDRAELWMNGLLSALKIAGEITVAALNMVAQTRKQK